MWHIYLQIAEFFGYSLALCDLTGDGYVTFSILLLVLIPHVYTCRYDELIVGAPMYSTVSPMVSPEQGRVYIYLNLGVTASSTANTCTSVQVYFPNV